MKDPSKKANPNDRRTFNIPMGKSNAPKTNRKEQIRECEKRSQKVNEKDDNSKNQHGR